MFWNRVWNFTLKCKNKIKNCFDCEKKKEKGNKGLNLSSKVICLKNWRQGEFVLCFSVQQRHFFLLFLLMEEGKLWENSKIFIKIFNFLYFIKMEFNLTIFININLLNFLLLRLEQLIFHKSNFQQFSLIFHFSLPFTFLISFHFKCR